MAVPPFFLFSFITTVPHAAPSGGARVLDQGGGQQFSVGRRTSHVVQIGSYQHFSVGRQTSHIVQIASYLKLFVTSEQ